MSGSYYALDAAYNSLQTQLSSLNALVVYLQSTITTPSLPNTSVGFTPISIPAGSSQSGIFSQTLTIPSAGKWLISAQVRIQYISSITLPTNSAGWNVAFQGAAFGVQTTQFYSITAPAASLGIFIDTIPSGVVEFDNSLVYPYAVPLQILLESSSFGATVTGTATAVRVANL